MTRRHLPAALLPRLAATLLVAASVPAAAHAQGWMSRVKNAAKQAATDAATRKASDAARSGTEQTIDAAGHAVLGGAKAAPAGAAPNAAAAPNGSPAAPAAAERAGEGAWANYDFVPGTRPLYVDDFAADNVGDFPKRMRWETGNDEVVEWHGARFLRATSFGSLAIPLPETLPERFTLEMDMAAPSGWDQQILFGPKSRGGSQPHVVVNPHKGGVYVDGVHSMAEPSRDYANAVFTLRVLADGQHVKVYMGDTRVANVPQIDLGRDRAVRLELSASKDAPVLIGNVRVMAGGRALYDALAASGRVATQGILFATASDVISPESTPTLKEIAAMLAAHPELKLTVEGHTDDVGDAAANQALSARRAAAVKQALVTQFGADAARLETKGFGATKPAAPNTTAEGRQTNRRVELVRR